AVAMTQGSRIHASDLDLHADAGGIAPAGAEGEPEAGEGMGWKNGNAAKGAAADARRAAEGGGERILAGGKRNALPVELNERQRKALVVLLQRGHITRAEYQEVVGGSVAPRTALNDLQDMVAKGVLKKTGRGPATRYKVMRREHLLACVDQGPGGSS
ncbi:MAG: hypothetical protein WHS86_16330, partial [Desulfosoma sp.]